MVGNDPLNNYDALGLAAESSASNIPGFWRWFFGSSRNWVRIPWGQFDTRGTSVDALASEWYVRNLAAFRELCRNAKQGESWANFTGTNIRLNQQSDIAWISGWQGAAAMSSAGGVHIKRDCDRCEFEYGLDLAAQDRSDFNPGGTFPVGPFTFQDDWFIWIRDNTPFGRDYWIYANNYTVQKRALTLSSP